MSDSERIHVEVAVALVADPNQRVLLTLNPGWGSFTLPMTRRRRGRQGNEPPSRAALRAAAETLGTPVRLNESHRGPKPLMARLESGRELVDKIYAFHVFHVEPHPDFADRLRIPQSHLWLSPHLVLSGVYEPVSESARFILRNVLTDFGIPARSQHTSVLIAERNDPARGRLFLVRWNPNWGYALPSKRWEPPDSAKPEDPSAAAIAGAERIARDELGLEPGTDVTLTPAKSPEYATHGVSVTEAAPAFGEATDYHHRLFDAQLDHIEKLQSTQPLAWISEEEIHHGWTSASQGEPGSPSGHAARVSRTTYEILMHLGRIGETVDPELEVMEKYWINEFGGAWDEGIARGGRSGRCNNGFRLRSVPMPIFWTIQARRHLRQALAEKLCRESHGLVIPGPQLQGCKGELEATMDHLSEILAVTFEGKSVVVQDQVIGFRRKGGQFVLMVEVVNPEDESKTGEASRSGPYVVKIAPADVLEREHRGWTCCRPPGLRHDLVFLDLEGVHEDGDRGPLISLVYGDAQQFLGVETTTTLEAAALEAVRFGVPTVASIGFVVVALYERIGHLLYGQSFIDDPARPDYAFDLPKLTDRMAQWDSNPSCQAARRDVNTLARSGPELFLDPIDYLDFVRQLVPWKLADGSIQAPTADLEAMRQLGEPVPTRADLVPRLLRGCAHGDLHGRNVLVGIVREQALWPTVFDYEDMGPCNLIGWDFVKLETELKIRAYLEVFAGVVPSAFVKAVQEFEIELDALTEECHGNRSWPIVGEPATPADRLRAILLEVRRMAARHLGDNVGRPNDWLEQYYFLLACYGVWTGKFDNLQLRERMGALISAGVATARLNWPRLDSRMAR